MTTEIGSESASFESGDDDRTAPEFSQSVNRAFARLTDSPTFTASTLATEIQTLHPDLADGGLARITFDVTLGSKLTESEWRSRLLKLYDLNLIINSRHGVIDSELALIGLSVLDPSVEKALLVDGVLEALRTRVSVHPEDAGGSQPPARIQTAGDRPNLDMLADQPLDSDDGDLLGITEYANALAELIDSPETVTPLTIAISAPWGAGKTSLARLVDHRLRWWPQGRGDRPHVVVWFNAWMHADADHLGAAFAAEAAKAAGRHRPLWLRIVSPLPSAILSPHQRMRRQISIGMSSLLVAALFVWRSGPVDFEGLLGVEFELPKGITFGAIATTTFAVANVWRVLRGVAKSAADFVDDPASAAATGSMQQVADQLGRLIRHALGNGEGQRPSRFVVFVDDLERCPPPKSVEICEVANQLLSHSNVVTVLVADMTAVAAAAEVKYQGLAGKYQAGRGLPEGEEAPGAFGRLFLQKMVQFQFDLPTPKPDDTQRLTRSLVDEHAGAPSAEFDGIASRSEQVGLGESEDRTESGWSIWPFGREYASTPMVLTEFVLAGVLALPLVFGITEGNLLQTVVTGAIAGFQLVSAATALLQNRRQRRLRKQQESLEVAAQAAVNEGIDEERLEAKLLGVASELGADSDRARRAHRRQIATDSTLRAQAEQVIMEYLPPLPRSAKRMLNQLRFLLVLAWERKMLGGNPELDAAHLGKWVVLRERWPEIGWAVTADPDLLLRLESNAPREKGASLKGLDEQLAQARVGMPASEAFRGFLLSEPALGPLTRRLVHFEPAQPHES